MSQEKIERKVKLNANKYCPFCFDFPQLQIDSLGVFVNCNCGFNGIIPIDDYLTLSNKTTSKKKVTSKEIKKIKEKLSIGKSNFF